MPRTLHIDADPGCDDAVMLAMAIGLDELDLVGVTTVAGNTTIENTTGNAGSILAMADSGIPLARGCDRPLVDELTTAEWIHGEDGLRGDVPAPVDPVDAHAVDVLLQQAAEYGEELTIAAVGPCTNLAVALAVEPDLPDMVGEIWLMGGAAFTSGNVTPGAEANVYNDPTAARRVFRDATPTMVGLDVTDRATVPRDSIEGLRERGGPAAVVADWLDYPDQVLEYTDGAAAIHDAVVAASLADPSVVTTAPYYCEVDDSGGPSHGAVLCDGHGSTGREPNVDVAVDIEVDRFRELLTAGIDGFVDVAAGSP